MNRKPAILQCGRLEKGWSISVRSQKAFEIRAKAAEFISMAPATYRLSGISDPTVNVAETAYTCESDISDGTATLTVPGGAVFFDNTPYIISINLPEAEDAYVFSPLASWCDSAEWEPETRRLIIPLNFGNDLGDFELCWEWINSEGERCTGSMSAQVFSSKLDIYSHFKWMLDEVAEQFQWIRLDLLRQTTWGWEHDSTSDADLHTWLLIFQRVRSDMEIRLKRLIDQHRCQLVSVTGMLRPERIRKVPTRLEEKIAEGLVNNPNRRYPVEKKVLDADTPENRYIKHILFQTHAALNDVIDRIEPVERIAPVFKQRLKEWSDDWTRLKMHRFWKGIGDFHGLRKETKVLSQDPVYAGIRRSWYLLQHGLQFLDQDLRGGIQNAAQLYEIWCLIKFMQLLEQNSWFCIEEPAFGLERNDDDFKAEEIRSGAVKFEYIKAGMEQVYIDLLFQPTAGTKAEDKIWSGMMAVPVEQRPDIVLRLHRNDLPNQPVYTWIFDAKYRLNGNNAPEDAVNQMHRYRDAILWNGQAYGEDVSILTRESIGAFVLYPGDEEKGGKFPQVDSIKKTNIGAFPLRPDANKGCPELLIKQLKGFLDLKTDFNGVLEQEEGYFAAVPAVRKPTKGIIAVSAVRSEMNAEYWENCRFYRIPVEVVEKQKDDPESWGFIAPQKEGGVHFGVFPIQKRRILTRAEIIRIYKEKGIPIKPKKNSDERKYWLFDLGNPLAAPQNLKTLSVKNRLVALDSF